MGNLITLWDTMARKIMGIRPIAPDSGVAYALRKYPGKSITGVDGITASHGDLVIELHLENPLVAAMTRTMNKSERTAYLQREYTTGLQAYVKMIEEDPRFAHVKGVWTVTLLHRSLLPMGFAAVEIPPGLRRFVTAVYLRMIRYGYRADGPEQQKRPSGPWVPKELFLSREMLFARYGRGAASAGGEG